MPRLTVFNQVSLDGYFTDSYGDMSFAHNARPDAEWDAYVQGNAGGGGALLFGRVTYELMAGFWPTARAAESMPALAAHMNRLPKVVFSRTLDSVSWNNTTLVKGELATEVRKLKDRPGPDMVILGSGSLVSQLAADGLIDEYHVVVNPVAIGGGRALFEGLKSKLPLRLTGTRAFGNGIILLTYEPLPAEAGG